MTGMVAINLFVHFVCALASNGQARVRATNVDG
jgi:hypothetical protein